MINYGEAVALGAALVWASTSLVLKSLSQRYPAALITAIRCGVAGPFFWLLLPFGPPLSSLSAVPLQEWGLLIGSVLIGIVIGDQLYLHAMKEMGVSRTMAMVGTFPITTLIWEQVLLDSPITNRFIVGCLLAASGVIILSYQSHQNREIDTEHPTRLKRGVTFGLCAAMLWGLSTTMLKPAMAHLTTVQANSVRLPIVALTLFAVWRLNRGRGNLRDIGKRALALIAVTGMIGMGLGSYLYIEAVVLIGPAKTATLSSATPVISLTLAVLILKEQFTIHLLIGVLLCVTGVLLVL